jgi:hypothetical protein
MNKMYQQPEKKNPLANWYRQPKIYVKLPSGGKFYPPGTLDVSSNGDYPVYAMTAKDELMFKTPDALLSGQSTVEVIKSCVPALLDPWLMPTIDLDFILIAIRIATYGDKMEVNSTCPHCNAENSYDIDLSNWMSMFSAFNYDDTVNCDPLEISIRPYSYREMTKTSIKTMEQQRIFSIVNDENMSDEEKIDRFGKSFVKITEMTVGIIADCVTKIVTPDGEVDDPDMIREFISNCSKDMFDKIQSHVTEIKAQIELKAQHVKCDECELEYDLPIVMDQSNFFGVKS